MHFRRTFASLLLFTLLGASGHPYTVTIVRDDWGIAHVHGHSDADAVYGMAYAQAEDDFNRVETNYLTALGRTAEARGETAIFQDLRQRLWVDPADLQLRYHRAPRWLQALMIAWAAGLNDYLASHPMVHPKVLTHFEPWMALSFTEGSIGGDIERVDLKRLEAFYGDGNVSSIQSPQRTDAPPIDPPGSNGIAIAPKITSNHHALLLINPHTSFYFRSELQMSSDEGLDAYGAVTWGQFFIYQGFNQHVGWMHTSTTSNDVNQFLETVVRRNGHIFYKYGSELRPVRQSTVALSYRKSDGTMAKKSFAVYHTHHGPIVDRQGDKWIAEALMYRPIPALEQSFLRTKAHDYASFRKAAQLMANSSNDTVFADDKGEIAFLNPQFQPQRDDRFDYTKPVDGADPATDWHGDTPLDRQPHIVNPSGGWLYNTNNGPFTDAGPDSPKASNFPKYVDSLGQTNRGRHAVALLSGQNNWTMERLRAAAYDPALPLFVALIPTLEHAYEALPSGDPLRAKLANPMQALETWNDRWAKDSTATSLAIFWAEALSRETTSEDQVALLATTPQQKLAALSSAVDTLTSTYGRWATPWGDINRFQRFNDDITSRFDDSKPSIPVAFVPGIWGSLAAFYTTNDGTKRRYGVEGNSFVAVVEFGKRVRAIAVTAGGESGHPGDRHFDDEAQRYADGNLRNVYFYPDELKGHVERTYHPGGL